MQDFELVERWKRLASVNCGSHARFIGEVTCGANAVGQILNKGLPQPIDDDVDILGEPGFAPSDADDSPGQVMTNLEGFEDGDEAFDGASKGLSRKHQPASFRSTSGGAVRGRTCGGRFQVTVGRRRRAFLGENLTHDPVARSAKHLGGACELDVDRHRIDQFVVFLLNVRHARQRSTTAIGGRRGTSRGMSVQQGRQRQTAPTRMYDPHSSRGFSAKRSSSACRSFGFRMEGPSEFGRRAAFRADGQISGGIGGEWVLRRMRFEGLPMSIT